MENNGENNSIIQSSTPQKSPLVILKGVLVHCDRSAEEVVIPDGVTKIGGSAFSGCENLGAITIPQRVKKIEKEVFSACLCLKTLTYLGRKKEWNSIKGRENASCSVQRTDGLTEG